MCSRRALTCDPQNKQGVHDSVITRLAAAGEDEEMARNVTATIYAGMLQSARAASVPADTFTLPCSRG